MNDLISRQKLLKDMKRHCVGNCLKCEDFTMLSSDLHCGVIDLQPTAYNLEAVLSKLEVLHELVNMNQKLAVSQAIDIVRAGGKNDKAD